jgi:hypothetical protein
MMIGANWRAWVNIQEYSWGVNVYLIQEFAEGRSRFLQPDGTTMEVLAQEAINTDKVKPTFRLRRDQIQGLVDALAEKGFTANNRRFPQEMDLVRAHLEDMRRLVFDGKGKEGAPGA